MVKNLPANAGDLTEVGLIPGSGRSPGGGHVTPVFLPGESHAQRSLAGYSPWGPKLLDMTEANEHVCALALVPCVDLLQDGKEIPVRTHPRVNRSGY